MIRNTAHLTEIISKLELILDKEIALYSLVVEYEQKKVSSIVENRLQDLDIQIDFQNKQLSKAREAARFREDYTDKLILAVFPHMLGKATLKEVIERLPIQMTIRLATKRIELKSLLFRLKKMNDLVPRLLEQGMKIYRKSSDILAQTKRIGYTSRGKERSVNEQLSRLVNKRV